MNSSHNSPFRGLGGPIFLIGFMGSGKSYWGKIWSQQSGMSFFDLDEVIEQEQQQTITQIFEEKGETYFRNLETAAVQRFSEKQNCIIGCGGGTPCFNNNMEWMNEYGITVYLKSTAQEIMNRVTGEQDKRPLIKNLSQQELLSFIEMKLQEREPFYAKARHVLPVSELNETTIPSLV